MINTKTAKQTCALRQMPIHHLLVCNLEREVLLERFFQDGKQFAESRPTWESYMGEWRRQVFHLVEPTWRDAMSGVYQVATVGERFIVHVGAGNLLFFVTGSDEYDELGLREALDAVICMMRAVCFGKKVPPGKDIDEENILRCFGKICVSLETIFDGNVVSNLNIDYILLQTKLKDMSKFEKNFKADLKKRAE